MSLILVRRPTFLLNTTTTNLRNKSTAAATATATITQVPDSISNSSSTAKSASNSGSSTVSFTNSTARTHSEDHFQNVSNDQNLQNLKEIPNVPLAKGHPILSRLIGNAAELKPFDLNVPFGQKLHDQRHEWYKRSGTDTMRVNLFGQKIIYTANADLVKEVAFTKSASFDRDDTIIEGLKPFFSTNIFNHKGEDWKRLRGIFVKAITRMDFNEVPRSTAVVCQEAVDHLLEISSSAPSKSRDHVVHLRDFFSRITMDAFNKFAYKFSSGVVAGKNEQLLKDCIRMGIGASDRMMLPFPLIHDLPLKRNRETKETFNRLSSFIEKFIDERKAEFQRKLEAGEIKKNQRANSLIDAFIFASEEENVNAASSPTANKESSGKLVKEKVTLSRMELRDQLAGALFGGFDTTTSSTSFIMLLLSQRPDIQEALFEEVKGIDLQSATQDQMESLKRLNGVINESGRLCAVTMTTPRQAQNDIDIGGFKVHKGEIVMLDHDVMARNKKYWNNADDLDQFNPSRWFNFSPDKTVYFPFGVTGRSCAGRRIALSQLQVIVTFFVQQFRIKPGNKPVEITFELGRTVTPESTLVFQERN